MPMVLAHPVAVLPLRRALGRWAVLSALVVGSMAPDLAMFVPLGVSRVESHSLFGLLWFCLPVGAAAYLCFHALVAPLVVVAGPAALANRCPERWRDGRLPARPAAAVAVSLVVGAVTHVVWDAFTHRHGFGVQALPVLTTPLFTWGGYTVFVFKLLQHGSTLGGLVVLGVLWRRASRDAAMNLSPRAPRSTRVALSVLVAAPALVFGIGAGWSAAAEVMGAVRRLQHFTGAAIFAGGTALLLSLLVTGCAWRLRPRSDA